MPLIQGGKFMQVDRNGDIISNLVANFYHKFHDTKGLALFRCKASEVENAKAIKNNHHNPMPEGDKWTEALRVPKPDTLKSKQGYRFDPAKIDWENLKKVGITADTLKNTKDFNWVMRGYKSRNTYTVSGMVSSFYLRPTDVKRSRKSGQDGEPAIQGRDKAQHLPASQCGGAWLRTSPASSGQHRGMMGIFPATGIW